MKNQDANNISGSATVNQAQGDIHIYQGMSEEQVQSLCDSIIKQYNFVKEEDRKIAEEITRQLITEQDKKLQALQDEINETEKKFQALQDEIKEKDEINQAYKDEVKKMIQDFMNESRDKMNEYRDIISKIVSHTRKEEPNKEDVQQETSNIAKETNKEEVQQELTNIVKETNIEEVQKRWINDVIKRTEDDEKKMLKNFLDNPSPNNFITALPFILSASRSNYTWNIWKAKKGISTKPLDD